MKYKQFFLENYKGIKNRLTFDLELDSKVPHCVIGNNESGKTTLLKGIELIGKLSKGDTIENGNRNAIKPKGDYFSGVVKLGTTLTSKKDIVKEKKLLKYLENHLQDDIELELTFSYEFQNSAFSGNNKTEVKFANSLLTDQKDIKLVYDLIKSHSPDIIYYEDFKFFVPKFIRFLPNNNKQAVDRTYLNSEGNKLWQKIFNDILKGHDKNAISFEEDIVNWPQKADHDPQIAQSRLRNMGKYLDTVLKDWVKKYNSGIRFEIVAKQPEHENDNSFNDYEINIIAGQNSYEMNERSKGLQWSFCFHILTGIRKNRNNNGVIFLLDEPASNLHIKPQNKMLKHLQDLCDDSSTVVYSTHSPELIETTNECYKNTFIAKNKAKELEDTDICLFKLTDIENNNSDISFEDLEPIIAKLAYEDIKKVDGLDQAKNDWKDKVKNTADIIKSKLFNRDSLDICSKSSSIGNFVITLSKLFG